MNKIRFAIIGCGRIAERHAKHIQIFGEMTAVCDSDETRARLFADQYNVPFYVSIEALLSARITADVVVICTPNGLHAPHAIQALDAGYHVLVEKPMALTSADCLLMLDAAKQSGKQLFTVMQNRFNPPVQAVKEALHNKLFGQLYSVQLTCLWNRGKDYYEDSWHANAQMDGGTLFTQFSHFIDLLYWLFGNINKITAVTKNAAHTGVIEYEDSGVATLEFSNGIIGGIHFSVNSYAKNREGSLTILGEKGIIKIGGEYLNTIEYQQFESGPLEIPTVHRGANDYGTYRGSMSNHDKVYENIVASLRYGKPFYADPMEGYHTVSIIERIYEAARSGKSV